MRKVNLNLIELTREEAAELDSEAQLLIFNSIAKGYELWTNDKYSPAKSKNDVSHLRFFLFNLSELPRP